MAQFLASIGKKTIQGLNYLKADELQKLLTCFMNIRSVYKYVLVF